MCALMRVRTHMYVWKGCGSPVLDWFANGEMCGKLCGRGRQVGLLVSFFGVDEGLGFGDWFANGESSFDLSLSLLTLV